MRKKSLYSFLLFILFFSFAGCRAKSRIMPLEELTVLSDNHFECLYDGIRHDFIIDLPDEPEGAPLIVMLPGWGNLAESLRFSTHFSEDANPHGYAVVYVTGARNKYERTGVIGWNSGIAADGNDDVGFLIALAKYLQNKYNFDYECTFAVGFSNGAFMIHRLAMEAGKTFSACVSVAGFMPEKIWNKRNKKNHVSFFQITGEFDDVVPKHSDGTAAVTKNPAIEDVVEYWAFSNGLYASEASLVAGSSTLTKWTYADEDRPKQTPKREGQPVNAKNKALRFQKKSSQRLSDTPVQVWDLFIKDGRHSWPEQRISGIDINLLILDFFDQATNK